MIRSLLILSLLAGVVSAAQAANAPAPKLSKLERTARHLFQLADADKNATLSPAEQARADLRAEKAIRQLVHDNTIGGQNRLPNVVEPHLADPGAMTALEFTQHFQAMAANKDAALRAWRIAKHQVPVAQPFVDGALLVMANHDRGRDTFEDEKYPHNRHRHPTHAFFQPSEFEHNPPSGFAAPAHWSTPATGHESGWQHEAAHSHEFSRGDSHGHGGDSHGHGGESHGHGGHHGK
jgi:hypothetical protein